MFFHGVDLFRKRTHHCREYSLTKPALIPTLCAIFDTKATGRNPLNKADFPSPTKYPVGFEPTTLRL